MQRVIAFTILSTVKIFSHLFYRGNFKWITPHPEKPWKNARLLVFLNHTSLFEPLFIQHLPFTFLWTMAGHINVPGADITLDRPIVGMFWKLMLPNIASITRKRDESWSNFLSNIREDDFIAIAPEGRMKRPNGLDKFGKPMTVRGGVADIIEGLDHGGMILCFSGGLHHIQAPGQHLPRVFKRINMNLAFFDLKDYRSQFPENPRERKLRMTQDLQARLERDCPPQE